MPTIGDGAWLNVCTLSPTRGQQGFYTAACAQSDSHQGAERAAKSRCLRLPCLQEEDDSGVYERIFPVPKSPRYRKIRVGDDNGSEDSDTDYEDLNPDRQSTETSSTCDYEVCLEKPLPEPDPVCEKRV